MESQNKMRVFRSVFYDLNAKTLRLITDTVTYSVEESRKKIGKDKTCIWSPELGKNFDKKKPGEWLDGKGKARAGVSAAVFAFGEADGQPVVILSKFDQGHPTRAGYATPPAGRWDSDLALAEHARKELGEEVILWLSFEGIKNGLQLWAYKVKGLYYYLAQDWVTAYAKAHKVGYDQDRDHYPEIVDLPMEGIEGALKIYVDDVYQGMALVACEPDTGSLEFIFLYKMVDIDLSKGELFDGEMHEGKYLNRPVDIYTYPELVAEDKNGKMTTKAQAIMDFMGKNMKMLMAMKTGTK